MKRSIGPGKLKAERAAKSKAFRWQHVRGTARKWLCLEGSEQGRICVNGVTDSPVGQGRGKGSECYSRHAGQLLRAESREVITKVMFLKGVMKIL